MILHNKFLWMFSICCTSEICCCPLHLFGTVCSRLVPSYCLSYWQLLSYWFLVISVSICCHLLSTQCVTLPLLNCVVQKNSPQDESADVLWYYKYFNNNNRMSPVWLRHGQTAEQIVFPNQTLLHSRRKRVKER